MKLFYTKPAKEWTEALPDGNGRLGAMVYGGAGPDTIQLNEETLWDGWFDAEADNPETTEHLDEIRRAIFAGDYAEGERLTQKYMVCRGEGSKAGRGLGGAYGTFQTAGELHLAAELRNPGAVTGYRRTLDLETGLAETSYTENGVNYHSRIFASLPRGVIVAEYTADKPFSCRVSYDHKDGGAAYAEDAVILRHAFRDSQAFAVAVKIRRAGGTVTASADGIRFENVDALTFTIDVRTTYVRPGRDGTPKPSNDPEEALIKARSAVDSAAGDFDSLLAESAAILKELLGRAKLNLDYPDEGLDLLPTDERIRRMGEGHADTGLLLT